MILVTVGTQLAFDRMIDTVDRWAGDTGRRDVFAQIGPASHTPRHIEWARDLVPSEFERRLEAAEVVISHAGMGTILAALTRGKPVLVMPRRAELGEQRNEHQLATATRFAAMGAVQVAWDEHELRLGLERLHFIKAWHRISPRASEQLLGALRSFLRGA